MALQTSAPPQLAVAEKLQSNLPRSNWSERAKDPILFEFAIRNFAISVVNGQYEGNMTKGDFLFPQKRRTQK